MTWLDLPPDSLFGVANLPYGVFSAGDGRPRAGVRIGDSVLDLAGILGEQVFAEPTLNAFMAQGRTRWSDVRARITELLTGERHRRTVEAVLYPLAEVRLHLPFVAGDYVDFFGNEYHAANVGRIFRPGAEPLTPNWKYLPIGYHGRSGTIVLSGTPVIRPCGQRPGDSGPTFGPSRRLDFEAEVGFVVGAGSSSPVSVGEFAEHVFGVFLVNDWSARDLQAWESRPLGPFLDKSFATSLSPWIVPLDALEHARVSPPPRDPEPLPYLADTGQRGLDLLLEVRLNGHVVSRPPFASMYWTPAQMLAHMTVNGASTRTGDLYASGTVSGPRKDQRGCMLELSWGGAEPLILPDGSSRSFLEDGDEVTISATAPAAGGARIGFGAVTGRIVPARLAAGRVGPRGASRHPLAHLLAVELAHAGQQRRPGHHPNYAGTRQRLRAGSRLAGITCSRKGRTHGDSGGVR
jgi:fumarylacetoacetase